MYFAVNFYKLIKQQYEQYDKKGIMPSTCNHCPCEMLRDKIFGSHRDVDGDCTSEMLYLVDKYNISGANVFSCYSCMHTSVRIAKKLFGKEFKFNKI